MHATATKTFQNMSESITTWELILVALTFKLHVHLQTVQWLQQALPDIDAYHPS